MTMATLLDLCRPYVLQRQDAENPAEHFFRAGRITLTSVSYSLQDTDCVVPMENQP